MPVNASLGVAELSACAAVMLVAYLVGSIPSAYVVTKVSKNLDITAEGSGNAGALNVLNVTGSRVAFIVTVLVDIAKGLVPVLVGRRIAAQFVIGSTSVGGHLVFFGISTGLSLEMLYAQCACVCAILGHDFSIWMALIKRRFTKTGQGIATGAGALLAYNPLYAIVCVIAGALAIVITRHAHIGQVVAAAALPVTAVACSAPDWPFALAMGALTYAAVHRRFIALIKEMRSKQRHSS